MSEIVQTIITVISSVGSFSFVIYKLLDKRFRDQSTKDAELENSIKKLVVEIGKMATSVALVVEKNASFEKNFDALRMDHSETRRSFHDARNDQGSKIDMLLLSKDAAKDEMLAIHKRIDSQGEKIEMVRNRIHDYANEISSLKGKVDLMELKSEKAAK